MPCYLTGKIVIRDIDRLRFIASPLGITVEQTDDIFNFYNKDNTLLGFIHKNESSLAPRKIKDMLKKYNISKVKMAAQKQGWKVNKIEESEGKTVIRLRE